MHTYLKLLEQVLENGTYKQNRTGTPAYSIFGSSIRHDLQHGFPLLTTKRVHWHSVLHELLWFLQGATSLDYLHQHKVTIWDEWATTSGELGPIYGAQWRNWQGRKSSHDQIANLLKMLKTKPESRRMLVSAWNPDDLPDESISPQENVEKGQMSLAPCHTFFQVYVVDNSLSLSIYQRSVDVFLGLPFNLASYACLAHILANLADMQVGDLIWYGGDTHLYENHIEQAREQLSRQPQQLPELHIKRKLTDIDAIRAEDFELEGYNPQASIKAPISI